VCQKRWLYLKQIFSNADIQPQLTQETKVFNQVIGFFPISFLNLYMSPYFIFKFKIEKFCKDLMHKTDDKPNALRAATTPGLFESLQSYATQMEKIQRSLEVFTQYFIFEILETSLFICISLRQ
jgi:dynein heavy chain